MQAPISQFIDFCKKYGRVSQKLAHSLDAYASIDTFSKGSYYLQSGAINRQQGFITNGVMRHVVLEASGHEKTLLFICENDFAGDIESCMHNKASIINIEALTDTTVLSLSTENNQLLCAQFPEWDSLSSLMLLDFLTGIVNKKTFITQHDALTNYKYFTTHFPHIINRVPLGMVASYLGIAQQSLSRIRNQV